MSDIYLATYQGECVYIGGVAYHFVDNAAGALTPIGGDDRLNIEAVAWQINDATSLTEWTCCMVAVAWGYTGYVSHPIAQVGTGTHLDPEETPALLFTAPVAGELRLGAENIGYGPTVYIYVNGVYTTGFYTSVTIWPPPSRSIFPLQLAAGDVVTVTLNAVSVAGQGIGSFFCPYVYPVVPAP